MTALTAEQRGDLAEQLLPVAARLACIVHGDGGPEDIQALLNGYTPHELTALAVVLAGLIDPTASANDTLNYLRWDEHGTPTPPTPVRGSIRALAGYKARVIRINDPRRAAHRLYQRGYDANQIAAAVNVSERSAQRWIKAWRQEAGAA